MVKLKVLSLPKLQKLFGLFLLVSSSRSCSEPGICEVLRMAVSSKVTTEQAWEASLKQFDLNMTLYAKLSGEV